MAYLRGASKIFWRLNVVSKGVQASNRVLLLFDSEKITKFVSTRCQILRLKCTEFNFGWGSAPNPAGGAYSASPEPIAAFKGVRLREMMGTAGKWERKGKERKGKKRGREGRDKKGRGAYRDEGPPNQNPNYATV